MPLFKRVGASSVVCSRFSPSLSWHNPAFISRFCLEFPLTPTHTTILPLLLLAAPSILDLEKVSATKAATLLAQPLLYKSDLP